MEPGNEKNFMILMQCHPCLKLMLSEAESFEIDVNKQALAINVYNKITTYDTTNYA